MVIETIILAIFYLNDLDHFIKEKLHIKYYIRYQDDGILLEYNKEYLKYCLDEISKFFYNIDHGVLKKMLKRKIKDKKYLDILFKIIDSTDSDYVNESIIKLKEKEINYLKNSNLNDKYKRIAEINRIPLYEKGKGLGIGYRNYNIMQTVIMKLCFLFYE